MDCVYVGPHDLDMWERRYDGGNVQSRIQEMYHQVQGQSEESEVRELSDGKMLTLLHLTAYSRV